MTETTKADLTGEMSTGTITIVSPAGGANEPPFPPPPDVPIDQVLWRIDSKPTNVSNGRGRARYISYIDARVAAATLDEWVGADAWSTEYEEGTLFGHAVLWCHLTIRFPTGWTISRSDLSTFSEGRGADKADRIATGVKGVVSDAFKRAAATFGVARNVYRLPEVWADCRVTGDGKAYPTEEAYRQIVATLRRAGHEASGVSVDHGAPDDPDVDPPAETNIPEIDEDLSQRIMNAAKIDVWRLFGTGEDGEPFPEAKAHAGELWARAVEHIDVPDLWTQDAAAKVVEIAEKILEADADASARNAAK